VALNIPNVNRDDISFGPAVMYLGAAGATPTADVGAISEDGVTIEIATEQRDIMQGNPRIIEMSFNQQQSVMVRVTSIEWNYDNLQYVLGGSVLTTTAYETFSFGGDPCPSEVAIKIVHQMCSGDTINVNVWRAMGEGNLSIPFGQDEHSFELAFKAMRASENWAGGALPADSQLLQIQRVFAP
jgi:hypothetical protein